MMGLRSEELLHRIKNGLPVTMEDIADDVHIVDEKPNDEDEYYTDFLTINFHDEIKAFTVFFAFGFIGLSVVIMLMTAL